MKKKISIASIVASILTTALYSQTINIASGWQLLGAVQDINITKDFNNTCIDTVWIFNTNTQSWSAYSPKSDIQTLIANNDAIGSLTYINKGYGYWIKAYNNCVVNINNSVTSDTKKEDTSLKHISFYAWDGISNYKKVFNHLQNYNKVTIYLNPVDNGNSDKFVSNTESVYNNGADAWSLISGNPDLGYIENQVDIIVDYNQNHNKAIKGIAFDLEPWTKFNDQNSSENRDAWQDYLNFLKDSRDILHSHGLKLSVTIPFWLNHITEAFPNGRNLNYEIVDIADETIIMDYTTFHDRFYKFAQNTLEYADTKKGKSVKIALEMTNINEKNISFYNNPENIEKFLTTDIPNSSFKGYVIHSLDAFSDSNITVVAPIP